MICNHLFENFLPIRQAYIFELISTLECRGVKNIIWSLKRSNTDIFDVKNCHAFHNEGFFKKNKLRMIAKLKNYKSYLSPYFELSKGDYSLIHGHFLWMGYALKEIKNKYKIPALVTSYGEDELHKSRLTDNLPASFIAAIDSADAVLVVSRYLLDILAKFAGSKAKLWHLGVRPDKYKKVTHISKDGYIVLSVGNLIERKGYAYLLQAIPKVTSYVKKVKFKVVGEGPEHNKLRKLASELGLGSSLEIIAPRYPLAPLFASADLFVLPSIINPDGVTEGLGVPLIEAQASCLPVVASRVGGITDIVEDGKTGYLVEHSNPEQLADAIIRLLSDAELRQKMGENGRKKVENEFNLDKQADELVKIYSSLTS